MKLPKTETEGSTGQFLEIRVRIPLADYNRGLPYFGTRKKLNEWVVEAFREKVNRSEANDKAARRRILLTDTDLLLPVLQEMDEQGKLDFLRKP